MNIDTLKNEARRLGLRVTKKKNGKRVHLSEKELKLRIERLRTSSLETQVRNSKKLIRKCKSLLKNMEPSVSVKKVAPPAPRVVPSAPRIPPAPPVPPRPVKRDPRANLMTALKANLERRGIRRNLNQTS